MRLFKKLGKLLLRGVFIAGLLAVATMLYTDSEQGVMPWPNKQINIYDQTGRPLSMKRAARIWNSTGLDLRIRLVDSPDKADVVAEGVKEFRLTCNSQTVIGCASIGKMSWLPWEKPLLQLKKPENFERDDGTRYAAVAAHEIGHLLGMQHNKKKCSLMNSSSRCREVYRDIYIDSACPLNRDTVLLDVTSFCPGQYTYITKCGPSYDEIDELARRYGGSRDTNYRSFCQFEKKVKWKAWCLYPAWVPAGAKRPDWIEKTPAGYRCGESAPTKYLAVISYAVSEIQSELKSLNQPVPDGPKSAFLQSNTFRKLREQRVSRLEKLEARYRQMMPERLRVTLDR